MFTKNVIRLKSKQTFSRRYFFPYDTTVELWITIDNKCQLQTLIVSFSLRHSRFFTLTLTEETTDQKKIFFLLCRVKKRDITGQLNFFILEIQWFTCLETAQFYSKVYY
jgi:hypothetical protein